MSVSEPITASIPAPLPEIASAQIDILVSLLPNPREQIITVVKCKACGANLGTMRRITAHPPCPLLFVGTHRSADLVDYDRGRNRDTGRKRQRVTSASTYSVALGHPTTPSSLPLRCDTDGLDLSITSMELLDAARRDPPRRTIHVR